jgi:hypothetical protein
LPNPINITALDRGKLAEILRKSGSRRVSPDTLEADIAAGAPVNEDGTVNLIEYAAWLLKGADSGN